MIEARGNMLKKSPEALAMVRKCLLIKSFNNVLGSKNQPNDAPATDEKRCLSKSAFYLLDSKEEN